MFTIMLTLKTKGPGVAALTYEVPALPRTGDIIAIKPGDDGDVNVHRYVVRKVMWTLPRTKGPHEKGQVDGIFVDCDPVE